MEVVCESTFFFFFFSSRRRHTRFDCDWSSDVCSSDLGFVLQPLQGFDMGRAAISGRFKHLPQNPHGCVVTVGDIDEQIEKLDRKSTRLNSSHSQISYAVFCLKKKK